MTSPKLLISNFAGYSEFGEYMVRGTMTPWTVVRRLGRAERFERVLGTAYRILSRRENGYLDHCANRMRAEQIARRSIGESL